MPDTDQTIAASDVTRPLPQLEEKQLEQLEEKQLEQLEEKQLEQLEQPQSQGEQIANRAGQKEPTDAEKLAALRRERDRLRKQRSRAAKKARGGEEQPAGEVEKPLEQVAEEGKAEEIRPQRTDEELIRDLGIFFAACWPLLMLVAWISGGRLESLNKADREELGRSALPLARKWYALELIARVLAFPVVLGRLLWAKFEWRKDRKEKLPAAPDALH